MNAISRGVIVGSITLLLVAFMPSPAGAATVVRSGDSVSVTQNQTVEGNFYAVGGAVALSGEVKGDAVIVGGTVTLNGAVTDDLMILGGAVNMNASGTKDVRIVAGDVTISQPISGSLVVVGGRLTILSTASIKGDVLMYGEEATIDGSVGGQIMGNVRSLRVNSGVTGGINITTKSLTLGDQADITGDVQYASQSELVRSPSAVVTGQVMQGSTDTTAAEDKAVVLRRLAILFLMSLFATLCLYLIARRFVEGVAEDAVKQFGLKTLIGFGTFALAPITIGILFVSVLGILVGAIELVFVVAVSVVALALMNAVCGALIAKYVAKKGQLSVVYIIVGAVALQLCLLIPFVGPVIFTFVFLATVGTLIAIFYQRLISRA